MKKETVLAWLWFIGTVILVALGGMIDQIFLADGIIK